MSPAPDVPSAGEHGVERWGINQLDDRRVEVVPRGTIIPRPVRRRLDRPYRVARVNEGRCSSRPGALAGRRPAPRRYLPTHAPVENTGLADTLVRLTGQRKAVFDVIRVVCANAEPDLAALIAPHLPRRREASPGAGARARVEDDRPTVVRLGGVG